MRHEDGPSSLNRLVLSRTTAALAALFLVVFASSAMRHVVPGLKEATRSSAYSMRVTRSPSELGKRAARNRVGGGGAQGPGIFRRVLRAIFARQRFAPVWAFSLLQEPLPPGSDAMGTSLPKRLRWKALGGHGRHGPG